MPEQNVNPRETGDWSVETLFAHMTAMIGEVDRRYEQRFVAQEQALVAAFTASEQALAAAFTSAAKAIEEADRRYEQRFEGQEKAINKAEAANEKRFEGVNEFRDQLRDQGATFMPRAESESRTTQNSLKIDGLERRLAEATTLITSRLDLMVGRQHGEVDQRTERRDSSAAVYAAIGVGITVLLLVVAIVGLALANGGTP